MRIRQILAGATLTLGLVSAIAAAPAQAARSAPPDPADEWNYATPGSPPSDLICATHKQGNVNAKGCLRLYGDQWWSVNVRGEDMYLVWKNTLWNGASWVLYREGTCFNDLGAGSWGVCNKDYYENSSVNAFGYKGSELIFQVCSALGCSAPVRESNRQ
ncbi:hypothetical protein ACIA3K_02140 [Micromonospora sp. NPDC051543]|uniref:hypothetical protein n=1 Tax=Micromonospora sp. NPDC051543 TaxID=3364287 RepID=UPI0037BD65A7